MFEIHILGLDTAKKYNGNAALFLTFTVVPQYQYPITAVILRKNIYAG